MSEEYQNLPPETRQAVESVARLLTPARTTDEVRGMLVQNEKGQVLQKFENYVTALTYDPLLHDAIRLNTMTDRVEIVKPVGWKRKTPTLTDTDLRYLRLYLEQNYDLGNPKNITEVVELIANERQYHPVCELLESLQWDGTERIRYALHRFLGAPEDEFSYEVLKLFMMGCIERVYHPGCKFDYMLCLVGGQGAGKSSFFRLLAIHDEWFSDDLKKLDDDNVYRKMSGHWIIEMSEMLGIGTAKSTDEIKSFLSRQKETYKDPYDKYARDRLRQCVFGGTTNRMDFLPLDRTGNRRFLPVLVDMDKAEVHLLENEAESRAYMLQMWAEAMVIYRKREYELKFPARLEAQLLAIQKECILTVIGGFFKEHSKGLLAVLICAALLIVLVYSFFSLPMPLTGSLNGVLGTIYTAEDDDILAVDADYTAMETALSNRINNIESEYSGYDEYRYDLAEIGHNPFELASYLTVIYEDYSEREVQAELQRLFNAQYTLTVTEEVEIRTRTETRTGTTTSTDPETGETTEEEYEYYILNVSLVNNGLSSVIAAGMDADQTSRYAVLMQTYGNKKYLFEDSIYAVYSVSSDYSTYEIPSEALSDEKFAKMIAEAEKYLGYPYVWGGSSPSTSFDCSGFVCWVINNCGNGWSVGRTTAEGLRSYCTYVSPSNAQPGDLIFFQGTYNTSGASHVGIYVGNGMMIHCGNPIQYTSIETSYWQQHFLSYGRLP